jgi:hypothetical protein
MVIVVKRCQADLGVLGGEHDRNCAIGGMKAPK